MRLIPILRALLIGTVSLLFNGTASADNQHRSIFQYVHTGWTAREGAPGSISSLTQTTDGYLWLGTSSGLFRFDGVHFDRYKLPLGEKLNSDDIFSLMATSDGGLWIGFHFGHVGFLKAGRIIGYGEAEGLPQGTVKSFTVDREGVVWAAIHGGLARLEGSRWRRIGEDWAYPGKSANAVFVDRDGTLWVASEDTVVFLPRGQRVFQKTGEHLGGNGILQITQAPDGTLWMTDVRNRVMPITIRRRENSRPSPIHVKPYELLFDREGSLWITSDEGVHRVSFPEQLKVGKIAQFSRTDEVFTHRDGLTTDAALPVLEDREGNIWVGTDNGLDRFRASSLVPITPFPGYIPTTLVAGEPGAVWAVHQTFGQNEVSLMDTSGMITAVHGVASRGWIRCAYRDTGGNIWLGFEYGGGLWRLTSGRVLQIPLPEGIRDSDIQAITKDRSGGLWVSIIRNGVFRWENGAWTPFGNRTDLPKLAPVTLLTDSAGRVWFGYLGGTIAVLDGSRLKTFSSEEGLDVGNVEAIYEHSGHIWVGGERGLVVFHGTRFQSLITDDGIALDGITGIVETIEGDLWLNATPGIIHIPAAEIRRFLENPNWHVHAELFNFRDGLLGAAQPGSPLPSALASSDGRLWFRTTGGAVQIDPEHLSRNTIPPPVFVRSLDSEGREYALTTDLKLPVRTTRVHIEYTALSFSVPERVRFRYKLEGTDKDWQDVGTRREAFYTNLRPGHYRFHVIACNNDGVWNAAGATLDFSLAPAWYQTIWFRVSCVAGFVLFLWALYQLRLQYLQRQFNRTLEARVGERTRIARELHDTLLQSFQGLMLRFQAVDEMLPAHLRDAKEALEAALDRGDQAISEGRDAITDIRASPLTSYDLEKSITALMTNLSEELAAGNGSSVRFRVLVEGVPRTVSSTLQSEIYRIARESLGNAFRHAQARQIETAITYGESLRLCFRDDGKGIDPSVVEHGGRPGHWGLPGIRERAKQIGAQLEVWSELGAGTEIELSIPGSIAYEVFQTKARFRIFPKRMEQYDEHES